MTIGERLKKIRNSLGLSQVAFADKLDVSKQTLYKYENNIITNIPSDKIEIAAKLGNVSPAYIMGWDTPSISSTNIETDTNKSAEEIIDCSSFSDSEKKHFKKYLRLIEFNRKKADDYVDQLLSIQQMEDDLIVKAAHERTDIEVTDEMRKHDDDLMDGDW